MYIYTYMYIYIYIERVIFIFMCLVRGYSSARRLNQRLDETLIRKTHKACAARSSALAHLRAADEYVASSSCRVIPVSSEALVKASRRSV